MTTTSTTKDFPDTQALNFKNTLEQNPYEWNFPTRKETMYLSTIANKDVGFMKPGMKAQIRVDAFPYTQFGSITGALKSVGTLPLEPDQQNPMPRFPAYVKIDKEYLEKDGEKYNISAGQSVQVNLILRDKRVISLLTDAVQKALDSLTRIRSSK